MGFRFVAEDGSLGTSCEGFSVSLIWAASLCCVAKLCCLAKGMDGADTVEDENGGEDGGMAKSLHSTCLSSGGVTAAVVQVAVALPSFLAFA